MPTPMEQVNPTPSDELFEILISQCADELCKMLDMGPIHAMSLVARWVGDRSACIDSLMQENAEFRIRMCNKGMDHLVGERDTIELVEANIKLAYDLHVKKHKDKTAHAEGAANEFLNSVCESHKKGSDK